MHSLLKIFNFSGPIRGWWWQVFGPKLLPLHILGNLIFAIENENDGRFYCIQNESSAISLIKVFVAEMEGAVLCECRNRLWVNYSWLLLCLFLLQWWIYQWVLLWSQQQVLFLFLLVYFVVCTSISLWVILSVIYVKHVLFRSFCMFLLINSFTSLESLWHIIRGPFATLSRSLSWNLQMMEDQVSVFHHMSYNRLQGI